MRTRAPGVVHARGADNEVFSDVFWAARPDHFSADSAPETFGRLAAFFWDSYADGSIAGLVAEVVTRCRFYVRRTDFFWFAIKPCLPVGSTARQDSKLNV